MIASRDRADKAHDEIARLLGDGIAFFNEMERRADNLLRRRGAEDMDDLLSRAETAYREMIVHARKAHEAMDRLANTIATLRSTSHPTGH